MFSLSNILSKLKDTEAVFDEGTGNFQRINVENAKDNLELKARARENGESGVPLASSKNKDSMAVEIDSYIVEIVTLAKDKLVDRLRAMASLSNHQSTDIRNEIAQIYENAKNEIWLRARDYYNDLFKLRSDWIAGEAELDEFRRIHKRSGPARDPEKSEKIAIYGWLIFFLTVEVVGNALLLGSAHPEGPIGIIIDVAIFGALNIVFGFVLGRFFGSLKHVFFHKRIIPFLIILISSLLIIFLNLFMAHYRDAIVTFGNKIKAAANTNNFSGDILDISIEKASIVVRNLMENPLLLDDYKAYLIVGLGITFAGFAARKSYEIDEPYPGYGKISREQINLHEQLNNKQNDYLQDINDLTNEFVGDLNSEISTLDSRTTALQFRAEDEQLLLSKYESWLVSAEAAGTALYAFYREENVKARSDKTEPLCFNDFQFQLPAIARDLPQIKKSDQLDHEDVRNSTLICIKDLNERLRVYQGKFKDVSNLSPDHKIQEGFSDSDFERPA